MRLTDEQVLIRDTARRFAAEKLAPTAAERDRTHAFPAEGLKGLAELGVLGMVVPTEWGGAGLDHVSLALAIEEIAAADGACSTIVAVQALVCGILAKYGTDTQKEIFLKPLASGAHIGAFALTEPHAGSDASALRTRAEKKGDRYILNGAKQFITSGKNGQLAIVFAVTDPSAGKKGISAFAVPTTTKGYTVVKVEEKMGQHGSDTAALSFDNMEVPVENRISAEGEGYKIALANLEGGRLSIAAQSLGMARAAYEAALAYAKDRTSFGKPIAEHQAISFRLADMAMQLQAARLLTHHTAELRDAGQPCLTEACMAKLYASEAAEKICAMALHIHGGYGYLADFPVERIYRDARVCTLYEGTSDIQRLIISKNIVGAA
jgi:hypothetical protein